MIIGISGKKQSGKDTVGKIIQYLSHPMTKEKNLSYQEFQDAKFDDCAHDWQIKKFASKLKQIVALLINCSLSDLENEEFKNKPLGPQWVRYEVIIKNDEWHFHTDKLFATLEEAQKYAEGFIFYPEINKVELTPRMLLQLIGTDCGRSIVHPNLWVNSLMSEYRKNSLWCITDVRFPNEAEAILSKEDSILIRVNSNRTEKNYHESETALDNYDKFTHVIDNNGTLEELIEKVKAIYNSLNL